MDRLAVFNDVSMSMIQYLESLGITDVEFEDGPGVSSEDVAAWTAKHGCRLPEDLLAFLSEFDGIHLTWRSDAPHGGSETIADVRFASLIDIAQVPLDRDENPNVFSNDATAIAFESYPTTGRVRSLSLSRRK